MITHFLSSSEMGGHGFAAALVSTTLGTFQHWLHLVQEEADGSTE